MTEWSLPHHVACTTGLYPFKQNWPELNTEKFKLAETLDKQKMDAKIAAYDADLSFTEAYKSFQTGCNSVMGSMAEVGPELKDKFPKLHTALNEFMLNRGKHEQSLKHAALIFRIPDNTKVRKTGPPRTNVIGEQFGQSRILNSLKRIDELMDHKKVVDAARKVKADTAAAAKAEKAAKLAEKQAKANEEAPLLAWLIRKGYSPNGTKLLTKKHMVNALQANQIAITARVTAGGDVITKNTAVASMKAFFVKYKVHEI